jgi:tetratricopeptide (TPR) repeat protein
MKNRYMSKGIVAFILFTVMPFTPPAYTEPLPVDLRQTAAGTENAGLNEKKQVSRQVPLRMIIAASGREAVEILSEIKRGKPFFFAAHDRSADRKNADTYGYLGEVDPMTLDPAVREALAFLDEGSSSGIIKMGDGRYGLVEISKRSFFSEGEKAFMKKDYRNAERLLQRHIELNPDDIKARMMIADLYEELKDTLKTEDAYDQAIFFKPRVAGPYEKLGRLYLKQGDYGKARDIFRKGLKIAPASRIFEKLLEITDIYMIGAAY